MNTKKTERKIINKFQKETGWDFTTTNRFLEKNRIDSISEDTLLKALAKNESRLCRIKIPKLLGYESVPSGKMSLLTRKRKFVKVPIFENSTIKQVTTLLEKQNFLKRNADYIILLLDINKRWFSKEYLQSKEDVTPLKGEVIKKNIAKLSPQQKEIVKFLNEKNWDVNSEFSDKMCKEIARHISNKAVTPQSKIATVRNQIGRIKDKFRIKNK